MDDTWIHTFAASSSSAPSKDQSFGHARRATLLQQPAEDKADRAVDATSETAATTSISVDKASPWSGPPKATLARRAQSYSDFYDAATAFSKKEQAGKDGYGEVAERLAGEHAELDFDDEFTSYEDRLLEESHAKYQTYYEQLQLTESHLASLLSSTTSTLTLLSTLSNSFKAVESQTDAFRRQCESLLTEQKRLSSMAEGVEDNVRYYNYLEPMTRRLNAPGAASLVRSQDFPEMLHHLDNCLAYMETHTTHSEAAMYRSRYRLLLTRALTLIRHHFTKSLGDIAADISRRTQGEQLKESTHAALLYSKFRVPAPELKDLGLEIQKRAVPTPDDVDAGREPEYASLMRELYQSYSATRGRLMLPLVSRKMAEFGASLDQADLLASATSSIGFMRGICLDEYDLWFEWFESEGALYEFLESLMEPLHDYLRPKTIHETKLEKLCELCATIQARYMDVDSEDDEDGTISMSPVPNGKPYGRKLDFPALVQPALEDAQTRLVFLALAVLRDGIEGYKAKPEDLEWPKQSAKGHTNGVKKGPVLYGTRSSVPSTPVAKAPHDADVDDGESVYSRHVPVDDRRSASQQWYPTLRKAIWLLRRIYRLVNSTVFDDLAHRVVHSTIHSLLLASQQITKQKSLPDGQLFLITHLLHLKQQIVAFDIEFVPPEVEFDFSSVTNTFHELRDRGGLWNPASWVRLASGALLPKVVENMLDAKAELDGRLRTVINDFVNAYAAHILAPISEPALSLATSINPAKRTTAPATDENGDSAFDPLKAIRTVRGLAEKHVPLLRTKLDAFVPDDPRVRETLVAAVRDQTLVGYELFFDAHCEVLRLGNGKAKKLSRKGKAREDEIWGPEVFGEAMERVFLVGNMVGDGGEENEEDEEDEEDEEEVEDEEDEEEEEEEEDARDRDDDRKEVDEEADNSKGKGASGSERSATVSE